ncbi:SPFH domain-containing protein [Oribacterium sp. HCP28S3_H8]|uniref:SPFH domain-containing protein n=1 Tax=Oribacterium sp. HCP28S3_H8 TaxID=3438945 RepID=UPI00302F4C11|nr:SPFH/Band 7/PHB domain protein [Oribacterium sp.]
MGFLMFLLILVILALAVLMSVLVIVPQGYSYVMEILGKYHSTWYAGPHFRIPLIERVAKRVNVKEQVGDFAAIEAITKDNVMLQVDSVVFYKVRENDDNPRKYAYGVTNPEKAIELLAATTLRNVVGEMTLDEALTSRDKINDTMRSVLDEATDDWGVLVRRVEIKSLTPNDDVRQAMEKQVTAERNKRAEILEAEGHKQSDILKAEGHKEALILDAEADKQKRILAAEAEKQALIDQAQGRAEAIRQIQQATAEGIRMIKDAGADEAVIRLKSLETLGKVADGNATKLFIPSDLANLVSLVSAAAETVETSRTPAAAKPKVTEPVVNIEKKVQAEPDILKSEPGTENF